MKTITPEQHARINDQYQFLVKDIPELQTLERMRIRQILEIAIVGNLDMFESSTLIGIAYCYATKVNRIDELHARMKSQAA